VRTVYGVRGRPGWDVCAALCPCTASCAACQLAAHVAAKGPSPFLPPPNSRLGPLPRRGSSSALYPSVCSDPCALALTWYPPRNLRAGSVRVDSDRFSCNRHVFAWSLACVLCGSLTSPCTRAAQGATLTGLPFWAHFFCSSFCLDHHLTRVNFGLPGSDLWLDCYEPCCCRVLIHCLLPGVGTLICCLYTAQTLENDRLLVAQATLVGAPKLMLNSEVTLELPCVTIVSDQPRGC
jgi:hypothetical protein